MNKYLRILLFLIVPLLLAVGLLEIANYGYNKALLQEFVRWAAEESIPITADDLKMSGRQICWQTQQQGERFDEHFCNDIDWMARAELLALLVIGVSLLYVFFVAWLGRSARGNRKRLLLFFRPAMYFTSLLSGVVLLANVLVWLAALFYIQAAFLDIVYLKIHALLAVAGAIGLFLLGRAILFTLKAPVQVTYDAELSQEEQPRLWETVRRVARKLQAKEPDHILAGMDTAFYATEMIHYTPKGVLRGEILHLSLPLCRLLTPTELEFVIGHELAHFAGEDVKYTTRFYPIYAGAGNALRELDKQAQRNGVFLLALLPATELLSFFLSVFVQTEAEISRARELNADKTSQTHLCTPLQAGAALVKVHAYGPLFQQVQEIQHEKAKENKGYGNLCNIYEELAQIASPEQLREELHCQTMAHPTDTHPTLSVRLARLGADEEQAVKEGLTLAKEKASGLINQAEQVEEEMSDVSNLCVIRALHTYKEE